MVMNCGLHGDVQLDDVASIIEQLNIQTEDALRKFRNLLRSEGRPTSPLPSGGDYTTPVWLQHPIALHDKLSRWLAQRSRIAGGHERSHYTALSASLERLGTHLSGLSKNYMNYVLQQSAIATSSVPSDIRTASPRKGKRNLTREEQALEVGMNRRRSSKMGHTNGGNEAIEAVKRHADRDFEREQASLLADGISAIHQELQLLKDATEKLQVEVHQQQDKLDETESHVFNAREMTTKVNNVLRKMVRKRQEWVPMGATMSGVGVGLLAGAPGGCIGLAIGAIIGGAAFGGAATAMIEPRSVAAEETSVMELNHGHENVPESIIPQVGISVRRRNVDT